MHEQPINWWGLGSAYKDVPALGWYIITFIIFVVGLIYLMRKPLLLYLETRALDVQRAIEEAQAAKMKAEGRVAEYEAKLKSIDKEIGKLKSEFMKQGQAEKAAFKESADRLATQISREAEDNLVAEVRRALLSLKSDMADAVIAAARRELESPDIKGADANLKKVFTRDVSELRN